MTTAVRPFRQHFRIWSLRAVFFALIPVYLMTEPAMPWDFVRQGMEPVGVLLIVFGVLWRFWAILYIGGRKNRTVVSDGPYSLCRHPLYLGSSISTLGFGLLTQSLILTVAIAGMTFAILMFTARREERFLRLAFGKAYDDYAARVPLLIPRPSLFYSPDEVTFVARDLRVNLQDAVVFLSLFPLMEILEYVKLFDILPRITIW